MIQRVTEVARAANGAEPWMLEAPDQLSLVRRLEVDYPTLEETGCKVGIGVATGADQVFIGRFDELDVEPDRKLPIVMTRDILDGSVKWRGFGVINPFGPDGKLVSLKSYPKLAAYLEQHGAAIKARHVSKKNPHGWYRTIDRIYPELTSSRSLLIPDIKGEAHIVYEPGKLYPHHNLYFVTASRVGPSRLASGVALRCHARCSSRCTRPRCAEDICAFRRNICVACACHAGATCRSRCAPNLSMRENRARPPPATRRQRRSTN
jgi:hypothetical protein